MFTVKIVGKGIDKTTWISDVSEIVEVAVFDHETHPTEGESLFDRAVAVIKTLPALEEFQPFYLGCANLVYDPKQLVHSYKVLALHFPHKEMQVWIAQYGQTYLMQDGKTIDRI